MRRVPRLFFFVLVLASAPLLAGGVRATAATSSGPPAGTSTSVSSSNDPSVYGQDVTFTATVSPTDDGGTVTFSDGAPISGCVVQALSRYGQATCTTADLGLPGDETVVATYSGDAAYAGSSGSITQTVVGIATTITASPALLSLSPATVQAFDLSATLTNAATGAPVGPGEAVTFSALASTLGVGYTDAAGVATLTVIGSPTAVLAILETDGYVAEFGGTPIYRFSSGSGPLVLL
jgi:large repetitive protein